MATSTESPTQLLQHSGFENDLQQIADVRKRKRMISNRESARRSRLRRQKQMDDLTAMASRFKEENNEILANMNVTTQLYLNIEAENSVLRAQLTELSHRLQSLNEIVDCLRLSPPTQGETNSTYTVFGCPEEDEFGGGGSDYCDGGLMRMIMMDKMVMGNNYSWDQPPFLCPTANVGFC